MRLLYKQGQTNQLEVDASGHLPGTGPALVRADGVGN